MCGKGGRGALQEALSASVKRLKFEILVTRAHTGGLWQGTEEIEFALRRHLFQSHTEPDCGRQADMRRATWNHEASTWMVKALG